MNKSEELAVLTAYKKMCDKRIKELRLDTDAEMLEAFNTSSVTERGLFLNGHRVGSQKVQVTTPTFAIVDEAAFVDFATDNGLEELVQIVPSKNWSDYIELGADNEPYLAGTGAIVPGVVWEPARVKCVQVLKCEPKDVAAALHIQLDGYSVVAGLLGGGADE